MPDEPVSASVAALQSGDAAELTRFAREHAADVLRWVLRLGGPHVLAQDVAQDVFVTALQRLPSFRGDSSERTFLFAITRNVVRNARRRAAFRRFVGLHTAPEPMATQEGADDALDALRTRRAVQMALMTLKETWRTAIVLVDLDGRTAGDAATLLGVPEGTVHSRLHHGRKALAAALLRVGVGR